MSKTIVPVILSGGSGQRLWPLSREMYPKQLINILSDRSLLQETAIRLGGTDFAPPMIVCNDSHRFIVAEQLREVGAQPGPIVLEPCRRNTAPAAALAALILLTQDPDAVMLLAPSDHAIGNEQAFAAAVATGLSAAAQGKLVTFGIKPDRPATGYGYIQQGGAISEAKGCFVIDSFTEKPDAATAEQYIEQGDYFWNGGIFLFSAATFIRTLEGLRPDMVAACRKAIDGASTDLDFFRPDETAFEACPSESIDVAVMEHTPDGAVVPVDMDWHDVGSWAALWEISDQDADANVLIGDVIAQDAKGSYLRSDGPLLTAVGVENMVIVATDDAVLVGDRGASEEIRSLVETLKQKGRTEYSTHPRVYRPWGWFQTLDQGERYQVKHLMLKPGQQISLQSHKHRAEHWTVVAGTARVTRDDETITLETDQSTYIPLGAKHRLENPGEEALRVIEVQSGSYLGEDDIVRFEDRYGRG
ncbi:MAG: mannose-1-phosphate guanylyltransferase/mannose-6-phosphate isomerase [Alphaproteobacteria bacterium]|jgi:mannose-1-phosphate guanylyltransferase / mannose-6-phosphate isomerase|nr:mannose-1-phosphate guanylyltransferase/mannose-6-phosphate isomerase [Alphaproteobacteria bacterium]MBT7941861.1 mannose-1-phosphate guanylyltransferase/mannose-6-phosphate isomerase [Alphaproteobacteria bacterium]